MVESESLLAGNTRASITDIVATDEATPDEEGSFYERSKCTGSSIKDVTLRSRCCHQSSCNG